MFERQNFSEDLTLTIVSLSLILIALLTTSVSEAKASYYLKDNKGNSIYLAGYGPYKHIFTVDWDYVPYHTKLQEHYVNLYRLWPLHGFYEDKDIISGKHQLIYTTDRNAKSDLTSFNQDYWDDLKGLLADAENKGIYVEISLFDDCSLEDHPSQRWRQHPFNKENNVHGVFDFGSRADTNKHFYNLENLTLLHYQELYVKKLIDETWFYSNVIYEIVNEGDAEEGWIKHWVDFIDREFDKYATDREPIIAHNAFPFPGPIYSGFDNPDIDMINWHAYAIDEQWEEGTDPELIQQLFSEHYGVKPQNYDEGPNLPHLPNNVITEDIRRYVRRQIWSCFVNAGYVNIKHGALDNYTDPVNYVDEILLDYFKYFGEFRMNFNLKDMLPYDELVGSVPSGLVSYHTLADPGKDYVIYINGNTGSRKTRIKIILEEGSYIARWFDPKTGQFLPLMSKGKGGSKKSIQIPEFDEDIVLYVSKTD